MDSQSRKILVLDDEAELRGLLQRYLTEQGYVVRAVAHVGEMDRLLQRESFDALVLDIMLPGEDGLSICRRLRTQGETLAIIMLTARGEPVDRIIGLEMGADDYLAKPFDPRELLARLEAQRRRRAMLMTGRVEGGAERVRFGAWMLDLSAQRLSREGEPVELTSSEFALLRALAMHRGRPLGRERLVEIAKGPDANITDRSVDVQIMRLRKLIEDNPAKPVYLKTVWGIGYELVADSGDV